MARDVVGALGRTWHLWCFDHGSFRGPVAWGDDHPQVIPCPRCGGETPDKFIKQFEESMKKATPVPVDEESNMPVVWKCGLGTYHAKGTTCDGSCEDHLSHLPGGGVDAVAHFNSGATRSAEDLRDPEGFFSPIVIDAYVAYMTKHRKQADGELRAGDNWQNGMPKARYMRSMWRHFLDVWRLWRADSHYQQLVEPLCAMLFNVQGMLLEVLISLGAPRPVIRSVEEPATEEKKDGHNHLDCSQC